MANTPYIDLELIVSSSIGAEEFKGLLNRNFEKIDVIGHTGPSTDGVKINQNALDITGDVGFGGARAVNLKSVGFGAQSAVTGTYQMFFKSDGEMYIRDGVGQEVQITSAGSVDVGSVNVYDYEVNEVSSSIVLGPASVERFIAFNTDSPRTVDLPIASQVNEGRFFWFFDLDNDPTGSGITLTPQGSDTINGVTGSQGIYDWAFCIRNNDETGWYLFNNYNIIDYVQPYLQNIGTDLAALQSATASLQSDVNTLGTNLSSVNNSFSAFTASTDVNFADQSTFNNSILAYTASNNSLISTINNQVSANTSSLAVNTANIAGNAINIAALNVQVLLINNASASISGTIAADVIDLQGQIDALTAGTAAGGSDRQIQFNDGDVLEGSDNFWIDGAFNVYVSQSLFASNITGSLTQTTAGDAFIIPGDSSVTVITNSLGQIEITSAGADLSGIGDELALLQAATASLQSDVDNINTASGSISSSIAVEILDLYSITTNINTTSGTNISNLQSQIDTIGTNLSSVNNSFSAFTASTDVKFSDLSTFNNAVSAQTASLAAGILSSSIEIATINELSATFSSSIADRVTTLEGAGGGGGGDLFGLVSSSYYDAGSGTHTFNSGTNYVEIFCQGGGGGGGGGEGGGGGNWGIGSGGSGGMFFKFAIYLPTQSDFDWTVGAGGAGGAGSTAANGSNGSNSTITYDSVTYTAYAGQGGDAVGSGGGSIFSALTPVTTTSPGDVEYYSPGGQGFTGFRSTNVDGDYSGNGGAAGCGAPGGAGSSSEADGGDGSRGSGGGGAFAEDATDHDGGDGGDGFVEIKEYKF